MEEKIEFIYDKTTKRPKRLENNVFILYAPEKIRLQPGEFKEVKMKLKLKCSRNIVGTCVLLQAFSNHGLELLNSNMIAQSENNTEFCKITLLERGTMMTYHRGFYHSNFSTKT